MIVHDPIYDTSVIEEHYSEKDGIDVKYVCTTELVGGMDIPVDVFYREVPHPQFGNRYFGIYRNHWDQLMITNADSVENFTFGMVKDENGDLQYSRYIHDYKRFENGAIIDGGRSYVRSSSSVVHPYRIKDGEFVECEYEDV